MGFAQRGAGIASVQAVLRSSKYNGLATTDADPLSTKAVGSSPSPLQRKSRVANP